MKAKAFRQWFRGLEALTAQQKQVLQQALSQSTDMPAVEQAVNETPVTHCPHCDSEHLNRWGVVHGLQRYRCKACRATFNRLTGTPLARLRHKAKWTGVIESLNQQETLDDMQARLDISRKTAVRWRHRFLSALANGKKRLLSGIVEADETFVRQSVKGSRLHRQSGRHRGTPSKTVGTHPDDYACVWTARDRSRQTAHQVTREQDCSVFKAFLKPLVAKDSVLCSDGKTGYARFAKAEGIQHIVLNARRKEHVLAGVYHIQNVNAFHARLKALMRRLRGVATKNLYNYLTWLDHLEKLSNREVASHPLNLMKTHILHT